MTTRSLAALTAAAALSLLALPAAQAATVDFEATWDYANGDIDGYYGGGTAADGSSGANLGLHFVNVSGLSNDALGTYYSNAPSPQGVAYAHSTPAGDAALLNLDFGVRQIAFWYASPVAISGAVNVWSGLDGTGDLLASFDLDATSATGYDAWLFTSQSLTGWARSVDFTAAADVAAFDDLSVVPEPGSLALVAGALAALSLMARARSRR